MKSILALILFLIAFPAQAEVFAWKDPEFDISLTYPDNWLYQQTDRNDARLYVLAPQGQDEAGCRVMASNDNRFLYVPPQGAVEVSRFVRDEATLKAIFSNHLHYNDVRLIGYQDVASLGKGPATMAIVQYYKPVGERLLPMQSIIFGGYQYGLETFFQCEALAESWPRWNPIFMNMAKTFDYPAKISPLPNGYYRDFMADGFVYFPAGQNEGVARY